MYYGAAYYPEHWPKERWEQDASLMEKAGINIVRVAEFSWAKLEPSEGCYDFSWLDNALDILAKHGIKVIMGTPTPTPPKWLMDKYPEIYMEDEKGVVRGFGSRRHYCYNSTVYRELSAKIVSIMAKHYHNNPNIAAWQIDNEFTCGDGMYCYCEKCRKAFIVWLKKKYGTIEAVNDAWGTVFWSQTYTEWDQIITPKYSAAAMFGNTGHNPGFLLDYSRFASDSIMEYCSLQSDILKQYTELPITHNVVSELYNYYDIGKYLDIVTYDNYPDWCWYTSDQRDVAFSLDQARGVKNKNYWIVEQQSGPCGWDMLGNTPKPGQIRLWAYQAVAHGGESILYFRWRACTFGTEQYWYGILDHDGIPRRRYEEVKKMGLEFSKLSSYTDGAKMDSNILLLRSFEQQWSHSFQKHNAKFNYPDFVREYYHALYNKSYNVDISGEHVDFSSYKLVIAPAFNLMNNDLKEKFENYVSNGGNLIVTFRSGTKEYDNKMMEITLPGYFKDLAGIELEEFDSICFDRKVSVSGCFGKTTACMWADIIKPISAEPIAVYDSEFYKDKPAVTVNHFGKGKVYYIGCDIEEIALTKLMDLIASQCNIQSALKDTPKGVEVIKRLNGAKEIYFVLNHNDFEVEVSMDGVFSSVIGPQPLNGKIVLGAFDVSVCTKNN